MSRFELRNGTLYDKYDEWGLDEDDLEKVFDKGFSRQSVVDNLNLVVDENELDDLNDLDGLLAFIFFCPEAYDSIEDVCYEAKTSNDLNEFFSVFGQQLDLDTYEGEADVFFAFYLSGNVDFKFIFTSDYEVVLNQYELIFN